MKIALIQMDIQWESKRENYATAEKFTKLASDEGCDIVVFPEMFNTGFSMNVSSIAEDENGETSSELSKMAKKNRINIIAGYVVKTPGDTKGRNIAVAYNRTGQSIAKYVKLHPFSYAGEDQYYIPGNDSVVFDIEGLKASIFICYDLRFPEVFRGVAKDVQAIFVLANWPSERKEHWLALLKARAIENQCFVIGVNRIGKDGNGILYPGSSAIFGPLGDGMCCGRDNVEFMMCEINPQETFEVRARFPFLQDMQD
jgi:predicted amidohydrolase